MAYKRRYLVYDVFSYFNKINSEWNGKNILDWGCNHSNFLRFSDKSQIFNYLGVDVDLSIIKLCRKIYPHFSFKHFPCFNWQYSHNNIRKKWPNIPFNYFDLIISFSVFTHTDFTDFLNHINRFQKYLAPTGKILVSFYSTQNKDAFKMIRSYRKKHNYPLHYWHSIKSSNIAYIYSEQGQTNIIIDQKGAPKINCDSFFTFYNPDWLLKITKGKIAYISHNNILLKNQPCLILSY